MEPHCLLTFFSLNLMVMIAHGALPPELYWKMMLPTTPVPKAITELLSLDVASDHQLHEKTKSGLFFLEENLHPGNKLNLQFRKSAVFPILPRETAEKIPFSLEKFKQVLEILSVKPDSKNAEVVEKTIGECESPPMEGDEQFCATSLESMVDFIASKLGRNVSAMSTEVEFEKELSKSQNLLVSAGVKKLADDDVAVCHPLSYPYAMFLCHQLGKTIAYFAPLEGEEDGVRVKAVAVCHRDTTKWNPNHVAFKELNVKPGTVPVCHVLPERHLLWFSN